MLDYKRLLSINNARGRGLCDTGRLTHRHGPVSGSIARVSETNGLLWIGPSVVSSHNQLTRHAIRLQLAGRSTSGFGNVAHVGDTNGLLWISPTVVSSHNQLTGHAIRLQLAGRSTNLKCSASRITLASFFGPVPMTLSPALRHGPSSGKEGQSKCSYGRG